MKRVKKTKPKETKVGVVEISRKEAIKKLGLVALSASTMILLLNEPAKGQQSPESPDNPPDW